MPKSFLPRSLTLLCVTLLPLLGHFILRSYASDIDVEARFTECLHANSYELCNEVLQHQDLISPAQRASAHLSRGVALLRMNRPSEALSDLNAHLHLSPRSSGGYYNRGVANRDLGRCESAIADFDMSLSLDKTNADAHYGAALCHQETGAYHRSVERYTWALAQRDRFLNALLNRGFVYARLDNTSAAAQDFRAVLEIDSRHAPAHFNLGVIHLNWNELSIAEKYFTSAISINSGYAEAYFNRALIRAHRGELRVAADDFSKVIDLALTSEQSSASLVYDLEQLTGTENPDAERLLLARSYLGRGQVWHRLGQFSAAVEDYDRALDAAPGMIDAVEHRDLAQARRPLR
ncbi:MAG TPA: tetratricopeptide repeat protein [Mesorhizobium sp.]|nr:tetratricopeptide repeat protein [Mesorhizobium sp.]